MKYFIYARKSTDEEDRQVLSMTTLRKILNVVYAKNCEMAITRGMRRLAT